MNVVKMEGAGNDYALVNAFTEAVDPDASSEIARLISDRHFGIGADGLILLAPPSDGVEADARMVMYNSDGSRAEMCGNGIRLLAKLAVDEGIVRSDEMRIETDAGVLPIAVTRKAGAVVGATVGMGIPRLRRSNIPMVVAGADPDARVLDEPFTLLDRTFRICAVSMGNPHAVVFLGADEPADTFPLERYGPALERDPRFPNRVNVEIVTVRADGTLHQRTWERGAGETLACGTGACAVAVSAILTGRATSPVSISLRGGDLTIEWAGEGHEVVKTGPAREVFRTTW